jgi:rhodanese-related sulfurtransferase
MTPCTVQPQEVAGAAVSREPFLLLDVRTPAEFESVHAPGAINVPLDQIDPQRMVAQLSAGGNVPVYVICKGGARARAACEKLLAAGCGSVRLVEGGMDAWIAANLPVIRGCRRTLPVENQVRIAMGSLVLLGLVLGWTLNPAFLLLPAVVGCGMVYAGVSGNCPMAAWIGALPWNRSQVGCAQSAPGR